MLRGEECLLEVVLLLEYQMFTFDLPASSSSQSHGERVGINRSERRVCVRRVSGSETWSQGRLWWIGGPTRRCLHISADGVHPNGFDLRGSDSIFVVWMIYKYFPLVSPRARYRGRGRALSEVKPRKSGSVRWLRAQTHTSRCTAC